MSVLDTIQEPAGGVVEFPVLFTGVATAAGVGVTMESQYVMSIQAVEAMTLLRV